MTVHLFPAHYLGDCLRKSEQEKASPEARAPANRERVTHEVWQMKKLDLAKLQQAFAGK
jgi:hypothetical protein